MDAPYLDDLLRSVIEVGHGYELPTDSELQSQKNLDAEKKLRNTLERPRSYLLKQVVR